MSKSPNAQMKAVVTGANGFIGRRLVTSLLGEGHAVVGLDLKQATDEVTQTPGFKSIQCDLLKDHSTLKSAISDADLVFHLAALTRSVKPASLIDINVTMTQNIVDACKSSSKSPALLFVSSLAACGAKTSSEPQTESDECDPLSFYGKSKLACETILRQNSKHLPISIARPPIVLGGGDPTGLKLFRAIDRYGIHVVPGWHAAEYSVIHVDDMIFALLTIANSGKRLSNTHPGQGIYFVSAKENYSYAELGIAIGKSLGRTGTMVVWIPAWIMRAIAKLNDFRSRITGVARYLNSDKMKEALGGNAICSSEKLWQETDFRPASLFPDRLSQTVDWYRKNGWLHNEVGPSN